tara:strand:- start:306 stop:422 length:117 start_codon:yes stop_codon:yes gene_type:complete
MKRGRVNERIRDIYSKNDKLFMFFEKTSTIGKILFQTL